jgi:inhibitor of KinA sporulation pathway (predicted exonuclease)
MEREQHRNKLREFIGKASPGISHRALDDALYAASELGLWPDDVDSVSEIQAITCWRLIERLRSEQEFPDDLRM